MKPCSRYAGWRPCSPRPVSEVVLAQGIRPRRRARTVLRSGAGGQPAPRAPAASRKRIGTVTNDRRPAASRQRDHRTAPDQKNSSWSVGEDRGASRRTAPRPLPRSTLWGRRTDNLRVSRRRHVLIAGRGSLLGFVILAIVAMNPQQRQNYIDQRRLVAPRHGPPGACVPPGTAAPGAPAIASTSTRSPGRTEAVLHGPPGRCRADRGPVGIFAGERSGAPS